MRTRHLQEIQAVLDDGFPRLRFPASLEQAFRQQHLQQAIDTLRRNGVYVFAVYALLGIGIYALTPRASLGHWPWMHVSIGVFVLVGWGCAFWPRLNPRYDVYAGLCACGGLTITIIGPYYLDNPDIIDLARIGTLYTVIVVYTCLGLRCIPACVASWSAGGLAIVFAFAADIQLNWVIFHERFTGANVLGMIMAYLSEHRNRTVYLQSRLLTLEKENSEALAAQMEKMSREDGLTGLANRRYFDVVYDREWRRAQRQGDCLAVMFIDIDHFKQYNDHYGHQQGDACLKAVAQVIQAQAKRASDLAARYGGEEFVVIYPQTHPEALKAIAERTRQAILDAALPHEASHTAPIVTLSIGLCCGVPSQSQPPDTLLKQADLNLYQAKQAGRNRWVYHSTDPI